MSDTRTVILYRDRLVYRSERFILDQGESLTRYTAQYVGVRAESAVRTPPDRTTLLCNGSAFDRVREFRFKVLRGLTKRFADLSTMKASLIHAHFGPDGVRAIPIANSLRLPLLVSFHGFDATMHDDALRRTAAYSMRRFPVDRARLISRGDQFIAVSDFVRKKLLSRGFPDNRVTVHYIGVDTTAFAPGAQAREGIVLFVGRLIEQKGVADLVLAASDLQRAGRRVRVVVVGDGPARAPAERLAASLSAPVEFVGAQPAETVREWMRRSAVFCVPSRRMSSGAEEGFGLVFAEAQAAGLPVVSYSNGGIVEAVADGETGFLERDGDWRGIARAIARLLDDSALRVSFGSAGVRRVARLFDLATQSRALENIYDALVEQSRAGLGGSAHVGRRD